MAERERTASGRAGGKVILLGEHAVVYGSPAIALGLTLGAEARAHEASVSTLELGGAEHLPGPESPADEADAARAFRALLSALGAGATGARAKLSIPAGAGLGASAALGVALARAVAALWCAHGVEHGAIARAALAWENVFHGNASGLDTAAAEHGGCLWFTRARGPSALTSAAPLQLLVALVEPGASTRTMVEKVATLRRAEPVRVEHCTSAIAELVERAREAILLGRLGDLGASMNENHELLRALGVSTPGLDRARGVALEAGALGSKLTGAGGGGCVIALVEDGSAAAVRTAWERLGLGWLEAKG